MGIKKQVRSKESQHNEMIYISDDLYWILIPYDEIDLNDPYIIILMTQYKREEVRLYLKEPKYVYKIFNKKDRDRIINIFNTKLSNARNDKNYFIIDDFLDITSIDPDNITLWQYIILYWNLLYPNNTLPKDLKIPDYSKLPVKEDIK